MSARVKLTALGEAFGWKVADNGQYMTFSKGDRFISVTLSKRGSVTQCHRTKAGEPGMIMRGEGKADRIAEELMS